MNHNHKIYFTKFDDDFFQNCLDKANARLIYLGRKPISKRVESELSEEQQKAIFAYWNVKKHHEIILNPSYWSLCLSISALCVAASRYFFDDLFLVFILFVSFIIFYIISTFIMIRELGKKHQEEFIQAIVKSIFN